MQTTREQAQALRLEGLSHKQISVQLGISKTTVVRWTKGLPIPAHCMGKVAGLLKGRKVAQAQKEARWKSYLEQAEEEWESRAKSRTFILGLGIYAGEGTKLNPHRLAVANCDPRILRRSIEFFECIGIKRSSMAVCLQVHAESQAIPATRYWEQALGLSKSQGNSFSVTVVTTHSSKGVTPHRQPNGVCSVRVCSVEHRQKVGRWLELVLGT